MHLFFHTDLSRLAALVKYLLEDFIVTLLCTLKLIPFLISSGWYGQQSASRPQHATHARARAEQARGGGGHAGGGVPAGQGSAPEPVPQAEPVAVRPVAQHGWA